MVKRRLRRIRIKMGQFLLKSPSIGSQVNAVRANKYLTEDSYYQTLDFDKKIDMTWLLEGTKPKLEEREYEYTDESKYYG